MKKFLVSAVIAASVVVAGSSFALFRDKDNSAGQGGNLAPVTAVEALQETAAADAQAGAPNCGSSNCGSAAGRSCCGSSDAGGLSTEQRVEQIRSYLSSYFTRSLGEGITVDVRDLGCHQEADIIKDGQIVKRLSISGNSITELS